MLNDPTVFLQRLRHEPAVLVRVERVQGSVPREVGAWMGVFGHSTEGTIGGGHLEWEAIAQARQRLAAEWPGAEAAAWHHRAVLGPSLGQCCGGVVELRFERVSASDAPALADALQLARQPVALFGAGHVGHAIVQALLPLPFELWWVDSRDNPFPASLPAQVHAEHSDPVQAAVWDLPAGAQVLVMSFSHAEDLDVVQACLQRRRERADLPFIGLIGSRTKWATFRHRLQARGYTAAELDGVTCPIGLPSISGKAPAVIAASVAAQLLSHPPFQGS